MFSWNFSVNSEYETIARKPTDEAISFEYQLWMTDATFTVSINLGLNFGEKWKQWARFRIIFKFSILPEYFIPRRVLKDRFTLKRWLARTYIFSIIKYYFIFLSLFVTFASSKPWRFFILCVFLFRGNFLWRKVFDDNVYAARERAKFQPYYYVLTRWNIKRGSFSRSPNESGTFFGLIPIVISDLCASKKI